MMGINEITLSELLFFIFQTNGNKFMHFTMVMLKIIMLEAALKLPAIQFASAKPNFTPGLVYICVTDSSFSCLDQWCLSSECGL